MILKTAKGTKDFNPQEMVVRNFILSTITRIFKKHGAVTIETPVFELKDILTSKYGEDSKLIYDLNNQGGELCSLRYDLTVPFARFVAMNPGQYKRYHIGKVYRRDQPAIAKGRMREFYQCDFDIAGNFDPMLPDSETLFILVEVLNELDINEFIIKINHRKILDGIFEVCGVPQASFRAISSAIDKLDKVPWSEVYREMIEEKGLTASVANSIGEFIKLSYEDLTKIPKLSMNTNIKNGLEDIRMLFKYLKIFKVEVSFDLSLARGLDYYTGIIYEVVLKNSEVGSIAAGGRYDDLVGMFGNTKIPCVGISIGIERIFSILWKKTQKEKLKASETEVLVISVGDGLIEERIQICSELWNVGIKTEFLYKLEPKLDKQFAKCTREKIPYSIIIGRKEIDEGIVLIKNMTSKIEAEGKGISVKRKDMITEILQRIQSTK